MKTNLAPRPTWMRLTPGPFKPAPRFGPRWTIPLFLVVALMTAPLWAQDTTPRIQVFGGYSVTDFDSKTLGFSGSTALNGGTIMAAGNFYRGFGGLAQATVGYGSGINLRDALFGPQFLFPHGKFLLFAHGLFGRARSSVRTGMEPEPLDTKNAVALGGGLDMNYRNHLAIRLFQVDYVHTSLFQQDQNNLRLSVGLVYQWGTIRRQRHRAPSIPTP